MNFYYSFFLGFNFFLFITGILLLIIFDLIFTGIFRSFFPSKKENVLIPCIIIQCTLPFLSEQWLWLTSPFSTTSQATWKPSIPLYGTSWVSSSHKT